MTPLFLACTKANLGLAEILINAGADPAIPNKYGWPPLHAEVYVELFNYLDSTKGGRRIVKKDFKKSMETGHHSVLRHAAMTG